MKNLFSILLILFSIQLLAQDEIPNRYYPEEISSSVLLTDDYPTEEISYSSYISVTLVTSWQTVDYNIPVINKGQTGRTLPADTSELFSYEIYHFPTACLVGYGQFKYCGFVIDASYLPKGFYLIQILKCNGTIDVKTIFI